MKLVLLGMLMTVVFHVDFAQANSALTEDIFQLPQYSKIYDEQRDPFKDAKAALALATKTNRHVLIEVGGNWCSWCHKMEAFLLNNPNVYNTLHRQYVVLKVNVSDVNENADFMRDLPPVLGYPHMYIASANGTMLLSKDTAELQDAQGYSTSHWLQFLEKWQKKQPDPVDVL